MKYDVAVIGAGHAGVEASRIAAILGARVLCITSHMELVAQMPCNPSVGGIGKAHLVREVDMLGGVMAQAIDVCGIHFKMLNRRKGMAVRGNRAQADKHHYRTYVKKKMESTEKLDLFQAMVTGLEKNNDDFFSIFVDAGFSFKARTVICATGTFLKGRIHVGLDEYSGGRSGEPSAESLTKSITRFGIETGRLKTGTSPRIVGTSIDFSKMDVQQGDEEPEPFSYRTEKTPCNKKNCYVTRTNSRTHDIIRDNLDRSPLYTGKIASVGPRYCPSIEDKVVRFGDRDGHTLFLEPEGIETNEYYLNGLSSSLPFDVQKKLLTTIPGLENARIMRPGYGIEYDFFYPEQLHETLESRLVEGLFFAGQVNGTSGYEEAAAQGILAGINAFAKVFGKKPLIIKRDVGYIGVLIDDIVTKGIREPYRMFTSRAEYRVCLRQDNADERFLGIAQEYNLLDEREIEVIKKRVSLKNEHIASMRGIRIEPGKWNRQEKTRDEWIRNKISAFELLKRPGVRIKDVMACADYTIEDERMQARIEADITYEGFIKKQKAEIEKQKAYESTPIPPLSYGEISQLRGEARAKFEKTQPKTVGEASRIPGITPADVTVLITVALERKNK